MSVQTPVGVPPAQGGTQPSAPTPAGKALKEQRAWAIEKSFMDLYVLEEYLDALEGLEYRLEEGFDRMILFANRDLSEEEARKVEEISGRVY